MSLTEEGEILLSYARRLLALNQEMMEAISPAIQAETLRLGVMQQLGERCLPQVLTEFKRAHPQVRLNVEIGMTRQLVSELETGRFDLVLGAAGNKTGNSISETRLPSQEPVAWIRASHSIIDPASDPLPLILFPEPCGYRKQALAKLEETGRTWRIVYSSSNPQSIQAAVSADMGIGVFARHSVPSGVAVIPAGSGLPDLPDIDVSLYGQVLPTGELVPSLRDILTRAVERSTGAGHPLEPCMDAAP